jgi:large subunit ribosomal protein L22
MEIISKRRFVRNAPDKIRLFSKMLHKKTIEEAIDQLRNSHKSAAEPLILVLKQAQDQIKTRDAKTEEFKIAQINIDEGPKLKRRRFLHQGRATMILKRMSHITIVLTDDGKSKIKDQKSKIENKNEKGKNDKK